MKKIALTFAIIGALMAVGGSGMKKEAFNEGPGPKVSRPDVAAFDPGPGPKVSRFDVAFDSGPGPMSVTKG